MVVDNAKFEGMAKRFPKNLKFPINRGYYFSILGHQSIYVLGVMGFVTIYMAHLNMGIFPFNF
mgnify:CR=1 FL=1